MSDQQEFHQHPVVEELRKELDRVTAEFGKKAGGKLDITIPLEALAQLAVQFAMIFDDQMPEIHVKRMETLRPALADAISLQIQHFVEKEGGNWYPHDFYVALMLNVLHWVKYHRSLLEEQKGDENIDQDPVTSDETGHDSES